MSRAKAKALREENEYYCTPDYSVFSLLDAAPWLVHGKGVYLEPCAGSGAIVRALEEYKKQKSILMPQAWELVEIDAKQGPKLLSLDVPYRAWNQDFIEKFEPQMQYQYCITNPPFTLADKFLDKLLTCCDEVVMLLRLNFLGSMKRSEWWQDKLPYKLFVLSERPSFVDGKTDATEYAWFFWHRNNPEDYEAWFEMPDHQKIPFELKVLPPWGGFNV